MYLKGTLHPYEYLSKIESLPIIHKPKHPPKKKEYKEQIGRTHVQEDEKSLMKRRQTTKEHHHILETPSITRSISNKEREGPLKSTLSLEALSPTRTTHLKIETVCTHCNVVDNLCL